MTTKKRTKDDGESTRPAKKRTTSTSHTPPSSTPRKRTGAGSAPAKRHASEGKGRPPAKTGARTPRPAGGSPKPPARRAVPVASAGRTPARTPGRPAVRSPARGPASPRIRASHGTVPDAPASGGGRRLKALSVDAGPRRVGTLTGTPKPLAGRGGTLAPKIPGAGPRKSPLAAPKRTTAASAGRRAVEAEPGPSSAARELALALAAAAIDKKAIGIEILDVTGKVDYADFLVVMTGRSDRHVHAIASGIEESMRARKLAPLSMEGLSTANWVLIDFSDVVVHVFQEEARALYDIEGLWIDAGRVPVPDADRAEGGPQYVD